MADDICRGKHCKKLAIGALLLAIVVLALTIGLIWGVYTEYRYGVEHIHYIYIIEAIIDLPIMIYFFWAFRKLCEGVNFYK